MQPKLKDSPFLRDREIRERDLLIFNLALRKALVKHGVLSSFYKRSQMLMKKVDMQNA